MFIRIARHWCKPNQTEAGKAFIDQQGAVQSSAPGFKFRYRLEPPAGPSILLSITAWENEEAFERFRAGLKRREPDASYPFERVEDETFIVQSAIGKAST